MNKDKLKKIAIISGAILLVGGAYLYWKMKKAEETGSAMPDVDEAKIKKDLTIAIGDTKTSDSTIGTGQIYTDYGDGWHYQRKKGGGWIARKGASGAWFDLTTNPNYKVSLQRLDSKYGKA